MSGFISGKGENLKSITIYDVELTIPPDADERKVMEACQSIFDQSSESQRCLTALSKVPADKIVKVVNSFARIIPKPSERGRAQIVSELARIEAAELDAFTAAVEPLLAGVADGRDRAAIVRVVAKIEAAERDAFIAAAERLLAGVADGSGRARIVKAVALIAAAERDAVIAAAKPLLAGGAGVRL
jgi:hypothetical protein